MRQLIILRIEAPYFVAGAIWKHVNEEWICTEAAPIISWMVGSSKERVKKWIDKHKYHYQWISYEPKLEN
jgi:hypothetical protein